MIDLTPLDVRNKRGDFRKIMRGYDLQEVDVFLELVAERLEALVRENLQLKERVQSLQEQVSSQTGREQAVHEALVTAQELRADMQTQAQREAQLVISEAETEARRRLAEADAEVRQTTRDAERKFGLAEEALEEMERRRARFLKAFRHLLEREIDVVEVEEERPPLEDRPIDLDLGGGVVAPEPADETEPGDEAEAVPGDASPSVDESAEQRLPLDASVEELAALYQARSAEDDAEAAKPEEDTLFLSLEDDSSAES